MIGQWACHSQPVSPALTTVLCAPCNPVAKATSSTSSPHDGVCEGEVRGDDREVAREAVPIPDVPEPSPQEVARHCLTHLPFRRWCRWCVMARRAGRPHHSLPVFSRSIPLFVMDDCFIKHSGDDRWMTVLVGRLYPSCALFSVPCSHKGAEPHVTARLASFLRACGANNITYMCDQEGALKSMMTEALEVSKGRGEWLGAVPEHSPVGESASNGRAERSVQRFEDQLMTLLAELEHRLGCVSLLQAQYWHGWLSTLRLCSTSTM